MTKNRRGAFLREYEQLFMQLGFPTHLVPSGPASPLETLIVRFAEIGGLPFVDLQLAFFPNLLGIAAADNPLILQTSAHFFELDPNRPDAKAQTQLTRLLPLIGSINYILPLGAFCLLTQPGLLYFKYSTFVDVKSSATLRHSLLDKQVGMHLHSFNLFLPLLDGLYSGQLALAEARARVDRIAAGEQG